MVIAALAVVIVLALVAWRVWSPTPVVAQSGWRLTPTQTVDPTTVDTETGLPWVRAVDLPAQARAVLALIDKGGPYPYSQDGGTFANAERLLPLRARGFYTEYTVKLPTSSDRGPLRIIMGGRGQWYFWTDDHYVSFSRIRR